MPSQFGKMPPVGESFEFKIILGRHVPTISSLLTNPAINVFLGTLPLLGAVLSGHLRSGKRLQALDKRIEGVDERLGRMEMRLDSIDGKFNAAR